MNEAMQRAAQLRGQRTRSRADRPSQRRNAEEPGSSRAAVCRTARPQMRAAAGSGALSFTGLACATEQPYEMWDWLGPYTEVVSAGAFAESLARADLDVPLVLQHVDLRRIARTTIPAGQPGALALSETEEGLRADAPNLDATDADVAYIAPKIASGLVTEMSFKFMITKGQWSPDFMEYHIQGVDIHRGDVAICGYGANPNTDAQMLSEPDLDRFLREAPEAEARAALAALQQRFGPDREDPARAQQPAPSARVLDLAPSYRSAL